MRCSVLSSVLLLSLPAATAPFPVDIQRSHQRRGLDIMPEELAHTANIRASAPGSSTDDLFTPLLHKPSYELLQGSPRPFPEELVKYIPPRLNPTFMQRLRKTWNLGYIYFAHLRDETRRLSRHWDTSEQPYPLQTADQSFDAMAAKNEEVWRAKGAEVAAAIRDFNEAERKRILDFEKAQAAVVHRDARTQQRLDAQARKFFAQRERKEIKFMARQKSRLRKINEPHSAIRDWTVMERTKDKYQDQRRQKYMTVAGKVVDEKDIGPDGNLLVG